jgi:hypothetical protein
VLKDRKKLIILISLVILWIGIVVMQRSHVAPVPQQSSAQRGRHVTPARRQAKQRSEVPDLKLSRIERVRPPFEPEVRNIFASIKPVPSGPRPPTPQAALTPPPPDPFLEEAKTIRFLGYAEAEGKAMAFIAYGSEALVVTEQKFRVKQVEEDGLILSSLDGTKEVRLGLGSAPSGTPPVHEQQRGNTP